MLYQYKLHLVLQAGQHDLQTGQQAFQAGLDGLGWSPIFDSLIRTYEKLQALNFIHSTKNMGIIHAEKEEEPHE